LIPLPYRGEGLKVLCNSGTLSERRFDGLQRVMCSLDGIVRRLRQAIEVEIWTHQEGFECAHAISQQPCEQLSSGGQNIPPACALWCWSGQRSTRTRMRLGMMICAIALLAGCAAARPDLQHLTPDLQRLTAGKIGCPPGGITISEAQIGAERASWTATCQGKQYFCAAEDTFRDVSCVITLEEKG